MTRTNASALYVGKVMHQRLAPMRHRLAYRMFWLLLDLDEIEDLCGRLWFFSRNKRNLVAFYDRDHGTGSDTTLRQFVESALAQAGIEADHGSIRLLTMPRIFGYVFNPLSVYFCHRRDATLAAVLYEVHNTFGQRHAYVVPIASSTGGSHRHSCAKRLYVSPFLGMNLTYDFRLLASGEKLAIHITSRRDGQPLMMAALSAERQDLNGSRVMSALLRFPLQTLKVVAAIHWHALLLWAKGARLEPRPLPPSNTVSAGMPLDASVRKSESIFGRNDV